jgi:hypothetical protein
MLLRVCRDGLFYASVLYAFWGSGSGWDVNAWTNGQRYALLGLWLIVMACIVAKYCRQEVDRKKLTEK